MSFNPTPEWTPRASLPRFGSYVYCPACKERPAGVVEAVAALYTNTYYNARHIPSRVTFTCSNPLCDHCDRDFYIDLTMVVTHGYMYFEDEEGNKEGTEGYQSGIGFLNYPDESTVMAEIEQHWRMTEEEAEAVYREMFPEGRYYE